jgi:hypothetical protein
VTRILSASRRTDLPGYHAEACALRLRRLRKPVHSVFFWTRYPKALIHGALGEVVRHGIESAFVHLTVTGLGGSRLEPRVPATRAVLAQLDGLIEALGGEAERVLWRFDPIVAEAMTPASFAELAQVFGGHGVRTCIISFPSQLSLKGPLDAQYQRFGIRRSTRAEKRELGLRLADIASRHGLELHACCQPQLLADCGGAVRPAACISAELAVRLHPRRLPLELPKDPRQRRHCRCVVSQDIGKYEERCGSGCAYCYSSAGGPEPSPPVGLEPTNRQLKLLG